MTLNFFQLWNFCLFVAAAVILGGFITMTVKRYGRLHFAMRSMMWFWITILAYSGAMMSVVISQLTDYSHHHGTILGALFRTVAVIALGIGVREYREGK